MAVTMVLARIQRQLQAAAPGFFSWEISSPDSQLIIANPEYLWHYDIDLETVTRRPVVGMWKMSPLQILGGDESVLREKLRCARTPMIRSLLRPSMMHGFSAS